MPGPEAGAAGRRAFLRKAAVAGTGAFAAPMIVTVDSAGAQALSSPPPEAPGSSTTPQRPETGAGRAPQRASPRQESARTALPRTGADIDRLVAAGLAATAGGAALVLWSADARGQSRTTPGSSRPADEEPAT
jgi:hypothetical protein